eukprot:TRINITY_DN26347_c0_g1_i1.p1 TRINITY_DN26347_c0_g1~~TRINITY_DN26347_c0_g1_i1.p1  ORF type:complete len:696 (-),score=150.65 TRINITY_DN26347_c0_g1_i1:1-1893(-)
MEAELISLRSALTASGSEAASATLVAVSPLLKQSLQSDWREERAIPVFLDVLGALTIARLSALEDSVPAESGASDEDEVEAASAACLKLARNLCANQPQAQAHWWTAGGLAEQLVSRVRADLAEPGLRGEAWREVAVGFLANSLAGNPEVRLVALPVLLPYGLAAACALVRHKPQLAFILTQNLLADRDGSAGRAGTSAQVSQLVDTADGHCVLFLLLSLLRAASDRDDDEGCSSSSAVGEWAAVFFHGLWVQGAFPAAYQGVKGIMVARLYYFFCCAAGVQDAAGAQGRPLTSLRRLAEVLCGHDEALALLWHSVHGILSGPGAEADPSAAAKRSAGECVTAGIVRSLLGDAEFARLASEEMAEGLSALASEFSLAWQPASISAAVAAAPPEAALARMAVQADEVDIHRLAAAAAARRRETLDVNGEDAAEDVKNGGGEGGTACEDCSDVEATALAAALLPPLPRRAHSATLFRELMTAALELSAAAGSAGAKMPRQLVAVYLLANLSFLDALHRLRFGEVPQAKAVAPPAEVVDVLKTCRIVDHLRLCGNVLYDDHEAQEFLRLTGGLRVLLSSCYADHELPLLREAGIFAVRAATRHNIDNQEAVKALLAERVVSSSGPIASELSLE